MKPRRSILVAGVGNVLQGDDAFGVEVARGLVAMQNQGKLRSAASVTVIETGIGGISLVQELMQGYDCLVLVDAVNQRRSAGELVWEKIQVAAVEDWTPQARESFLADMHYANPNRALMLAKALEVLPEEVYLMGCQAAEDDFALGLSDPVKEAVPEAIAQIEGFLRGLGERTT